MLDQAEISIDQLRVGLYVHLDLKWFEHPFAFSHFKIKDEDQIQVLRGLGLRTVRISPALSDPGATPGPAAGAGVAADGAAAASAPAPAPALPAMQQAKRAMVERINQQREQAGQIEKAFLDAARTIRSIETNLFSNPAASVAQASQLVTQIVDSILCAPELAIHVMGDKVGGEELYLHSLNVTMLAMMIARDIQLPHAVISMLGMGALLHDIGHKKVSDKILNKPEALTRAEQNAYQLHCQYGAEMAQELALAPAVAAIIRDHHELYDGSGYPRALKGEAINVLARIVAIADHYDELCNPTHLGAALTPHDALSLMFARQRDKFDPKLLQIFIRCLGVYPPGTVVQLSNGVLGMVATVNTSKPMKPIVVIYDAAVPKHEAILVDMERETGLNIVKSLKPAQVPQDVLLYLSPRKRVSYYFDASKAGQGAAAS
ncbi:HD-GYP domain-containing protein [Duganella sp. FT3S]|uniref:HD-GYP domain-containing protein n=1 Tax=Rugamonas fusca TaxID=2758568 RepID=A0A7W2EJU8_9BURK|nr:HD-GYP domain-containing protein [Rugamonas fusca]MBA5607231.1 HD-GYP domain-containing protein [Rugamonas fusca]